MESSNRLCGAYPRCWVSKSCCLNVWGVACVAFTVASRRRLVQSFIMRVDHGKLGSSLKIDTTSVPKNNE